MIPKIYKADEREFKNNGFGFLKDVIKSQAYEERNGEFKITLEYPVNGVLADKLVRENIIMYKASDRMGKQPFRIHSVTSKQESRLYVVEARHVTFDDLDNFLIDVETQLSPKLFLPQLNSHLILNTGITYESNNDTTPTVKLKWERKNPLALVAGEEGSLLQIFGGDIKRDFWKVHFDKARGRKGKVTVRNKRDLTGLDLVENDDDAVTRIYPFKIIQEDDPNVEGGKIDTVITLPEKFIDSKNINKYKNPKIYPIDFGGDERVVDVNSLRKFAQPYFTEHTGIDLPKVSGTINIQQLVKTTEFKDFADILSVDVCDNINVVSSVTGVRISAQVNSITYDGVAEEYISLDIGDRLLSFGEANKKQWNWVNNQIGNINNSISDIEAGASFGNNAFWGKNPPVYHKKGDLWFKQLEDGSAELYQWDGFGWELRIDPAIDEKIKEQIEDLETGMEDAKQQADDANKKAEEAIKDVGFASDNASSAIEEAQKAMQGSEEAKASVKEVDGKITGVATKVGDLETNVAQLELDSKGMKVTVAEVDNTIKNLDGISRNMLKHSKFENGSKYGTSKIAMMNYAFDAKNAVLGMNAKESGVGQRNVGIFQIGSNMNKPTEVGKWYTFSVEVRGDGWAESSLMVGIESQGNGGKAGMIPDVKPTGGWTRYQTTFKAIKASTGAVYYFEPLRTGAWVEFRSPMLNEGKVTGGYQQAPEDIGTAVSVASLEVKADGIQATVKNKADKSQVTQLADQITSVVEGQEKSPVNFNRYHDVWNKSKMYFSKTGTEPIATNIATNYLEKDSFILKETTLNTWTTNKMVATIAPKTTTSGLLSFPQPNSSKANAIKSRKHKTVATMKVKYLGDSPSGGGTRNSVEVNFFFGGVNIIGQELKKNEWVTISLAGDGTKATYGGATGITIDYDPTFSSSFEFKDIGYFSDETTIPTPFPPFVVPALTNQVVDQNKTYSSTDSKIKVYKWNSLEKIISVEKNTTFLDSMIIGLPDDRLLHGGSMVTFTAKVRYKGTELNPATPESPLVKQSLILKPMPFGRLVEGNKIRTTNYNESHLIDNKNWTTITKTVILNVDSSIGGIEINYPGMGNIPGGEVWDTTNKHFYEFSEIGFYEGGVRPAIVKDDYTPDIDAPLNNIEYDVDATSDETFAIAKFPKGSKQGSFGFPVYDNPYLEEGKEYIMTFTLSKTGGSNTISKGAYVSPNNYGGVAKDVLFELTDAKPSVIINQKFIFKKEPTTDRFNRIRFWTGRSDKLPIGQTFKISKVGIYEGSVPPIVLDNYPSAAVTRSSITQLADNINFKVDKDSVISQINLSPGGVLIQGKNIWLDGNTKIEKAVIKSANIESVSASQISAGTIDAKEINVINLTANAIRTGSIVGKNLEINLDSGVVTFQHGKIQKPDGRFTIDIDKGTIETISLTRSGRTLIESGKLSFWQQTHPGGLFELTKLGSISSGNPDWHTGDVLSVAGSLGVVMGTEGSFNNLFDVEGAKVVTRGRTGTVVVAQGARYWSPTSGGEPILDYMKGKNFAIVAVQTIDYSDSKLEYKVLVDSEIGYKWVLEQDIVNKKPNYNRNANTVSVSGENKIEFLAGHSDHDYFNQIAQRVRFDSSGMFFNGNIREMFTSLTPSLKESGTLKFAEDHIKAYYGAHIRMVTGNDGEATFTQNIWNGPWAVVKGNLQNQSHRFQKTNIVDMEDGAIDKLGKLRFREYNRVADLKHGRLSNEWGLVTDEIPFNELVGKDREGIVLYPLVSLVGKGLQEEVAKRKTLEERVAQLEKIIENLVK